MERGCKILLIPENRKDMRNFRSDAQYTTILRGMMRHKTQAIIWDLLTWLETDAQVDSVRDLLQYIRLVSDFGDTAQGKLFFGLIKENTKTLRLVTPEIAGRFVSRGETTDCAWLKELGILIQTLHKQQAGEPVGAEKR